jgi:hypothetical protein
LSVPLHRIDFDCPDEVALHDQLVALVDDMIAAQRELAGYSRYYLGERLTRLRESDPLPPLSRQRVAAGLPPGQQRGLRYVVTEKMVKTGPGGEFVIKAANVVKALPFGGKKQVLVTARDGSVLELTGPAELMPFVAEALEGWPGRPWAEAREQVIVPRNLDVLQDQIKEIQAAVSDLRQRLSRAQDEMDRIVSDLYGLGEEDLSVIARELG